MKLFKKITLSTIGLILKILGTVGVAVITLMFFKTLIEFLLWILEIDIHTATDGEVVGVIFLCIGILAGLSYLIINRD